MKNQTITSPQSSLISHAWKPTGRYSALFLFALFASLFLVQQTARAQEIDLFYTDRTDLTWNDSGSGAKRTGSFWKPNVPANQNLRTLCHAARGGTHSPPIEMVVAKSLTGTALANPVSFELIWTDAGSGADMDAAFYRPVPPPGYVSLGDVCFNPNLGAPDLSSVVCVRSDLVVQGTVGGSFWDGYESGASDFSAWQIVAPEGAIDIGAFVAHPLSVLWQPGGPVYCLKASAVTAIPAPSDAQLDQLIYEHGPIIKFHPNELYMPDDPAAMLDDPATTLQWMTVQNENDFDSFAQTVLGTVPTSSGSILNDAQVALAHPLASDPSFKYLINYPESLAGGNLGRAKAFVRVQPLSGGRLTELQFWYFCPWNGNGKARVTVPTPPFDDYVSFIDPTGTMGRHYSDWECVRVRVTQKSVWNPGVYTMANVVLSRHSGEEEVSATDPRLETYFGSPVIYAAKDSHAHYLSAGINYYQRKFEKDVGVGTLALDLYDLTGAGQSLQTYLSSKHIIVSSAWPSVATTRPDWLFFGGQWGGYHLNIYTATFDIPTYGPYSYSEKEVGNGKPGLIRRSEWTVATPQNANLGTLRTSSGTLNPTFDPLVAAYTMTVPNGVSQLRVTPQSEDYNALVEVKVNAGAYSGLGSGKLLGKLSEVLPLTNGINTVSIRVTVPPPSAPIAGVTPTVKTYTITVTAQLPEIAMEVPVGTPLNNGATVDFGTQPSGSPTEPKIFTIKNTGNVPLNISGVSFLGAPSTDFTINTSGMLTSIPATGQTTFTVTFTPATLGLRAAYLAVDNDDLDEGASRFILNGTGVAVAPPSRPEAVDAPELLWTTSGNSVWNGQTAIKHDGVDAAQSGVIGNSQTSVLQTTVNGPGTLTFWWKVSSETDSDFLRFQMDGVETAAAPAISGEMDWEQKTVPVPSGSHALFWTYSKDNLYPRGSDAAWLDQVVFTPVSPVITSPLTASGTLGEPFNYQIAAANNPTSYNATGLPAGVTVNTSTGLISGTPTVGGNFSATLTAINAGGSGTATLTLSISAFPIATALDTPGRTWTSGSGQFGNWFGQTNITKDGVDAAQSGVIGNLQQIVLETTVTGPGTLTFWWKVSSEVNYDFLDFRMTGVGTTTGFGTTGEVDWQQRTVVVPAGSNTLIWTYGKDGSDSAGLDAGWLDQVVFIPTQPEIAIDLPLGTLAAGSVVAWGENGNGQTTVPLAAQSAVIGIAAGYVHTAALKTDGTVVAWGSNGYGETNVPVDLNGVVAIAGTRFHTAALKSDGTVRTWGYGTETTVPPGLNDVRAIAAGFAFTVALKNDGSVVAWGNNSHGQATVPAAALSGVIAIAANDLHALALKSDGSVIAWGNPANGRTTVPATALSGVIAIAAGGNHSLALKSDGTIIAWGQSSEGQTTVPAGLSGVVAIAAGDFNSAAIKSDGSVVAWGYPDFGFNTVPVAALSNALAIAGGGNHAVALVGTRIVDFGSQPIGVAGPWKTFTIKNTGSAALSITSVSVVGFNSGDFAVDTSGMLASIPAAGQTTFRVLFNAGAPGARPIILRVLNNDADESITDITLTGTGSTTLASLQFGVSGAGTNTLTFVGIPGSQYIAQYATNLSTSPWFDFRTNAAGTNGLWQVIAPNATNVQRFYRVRTP